MKYLIPLVLFLVSCTTPQIISPLDKQGNQIHSVLKEPFFGSPNQASEWSFWYIIICVIVVYAIWREAKAIYYDCKKVKNPEEQEINNP